jgi:hypothetical protein
MSAGWADHYTAFADWYEVGGVVQRVGDVLQAGTQAYDTVVILGFAGTKHGDWYAKLCRPYAYADTIGVVPNFLLGCEIFDVNCQTLNQYKRLAGQYKAR